MSNPDVYSRIHELDPATVDAIAARLEARAASPRYMRMLHDYLAEAAVEDVESALALGAGTGVEVRALAGREGFAGRVTALEISERLAAAGRDRAAAEGLADRIGWAIGDAHRLEFPDASFDLVTAHTLLSHVDQPFRVLEEATRVLRLGGRLVVFDGDYATLTFGTEDPEEGRLWDERIIRALIANPRVMRAMPRQFRRLGLELEGARATPLYEIGQADFLLAGLRSFPVLLAKAGVATPEAVQAFVDDQLRASDAGTFFGGYNFVTCVGRKAPRAA